VNHDVGAALLAAILAEPQRGLLRIQAEIAAILLTKAFELTRTDLRLAVPVQKQPSQVARDRLAKKLVPQMIYLIDVADKS
jgi:hypothetical protein